MELFFTVFVVFAVLIACEVWWRHAAVEDEFSRKFVHILIGSFVAFWPFFLSWDQILGLSLAFLVVVLVSRSLGVFQAIHSVQRPTWGEVFFALAVGLVVLLTHDKWIYAAALLQMSLADGLAAAVGVRFGKRSAYKVFGHTKSVAGTITFFVVSFFILLGFSHWSGTELSLAWMLGASALASLIENIGVRGFDNLLIPLAITLLLLNS